MATESNDQIRGRPLRCSWPEKFTTRRKFDRVTESRPYLEYLRMEAFLGEENEGDNDKLSDDDDETSNELDKKENQSEIQKDENDAKSHNLYSNVRLFMRGHEGDEDLLDHDQVDAVASFCDQENPEGSESTSDQARKHVALLDDRNMHGTIGGDKKGYCKPYLKPQTALQLRENLSHKVTFRFIPSSKDVNILTHIEQRFKLVSGQSTPTNPFEDGDFEVERRVV